MTPRPAHERVLARVVYSDTPFAGQPCWVFVGSKDRGGYGSVITGSRTDGSKRSAKTHRVVYEALVGPIPDGLHIDHLCRVRSCCNPAHLEAVTNRENVLRGVNPAAVNAAKTECSRGHAYTPDNTYTSPKGRRSCRVCERERQAARPKRQRLWSKRGAA